MIPRRFRSRWCAVTAITVVLLLAFAPATAFAAGEPEVADVDPDAWDEPQAPMLAALVDAGELPPLEERLPVNPMVIEPRDEIGRYGGEIRTNISPTGDGPWLHRSVGHGGGVVVWDPNWEQVIPNTAAHYEVSDDVREFTFELREGMRWSDGEPFTTADVEWWYEHELLNEELTPVMSGTWLSATREVVELEVIDETTFRFIFDEPNGLFLEDLVNWSPTPKHYGQQLHADFNEDAQAIAEDEGYDTWMDLYDVLIQDSGYQVNPEKPVLNPWKVVEGATYTGEYTRLTFERNPYFHRVDTEGNQLPYVDRWNFDVLDDSEVVTLQILAGEIDFGHRGGTGDDARPVVFDGQEAGDYHVVFATQSNSVVAAISLNKTHDDEQWRELARNRDFRVGLSYAIDREEINDILYGGASWPRQAAPYEEMDFYHEEFAKQYTEYDPDLALEYFDRAGLEQDRDGRWLGPDGNRIVVPIDTQVGSAHMDELELIQSHWAEVGIELEINSMDRSLLTERFMNNQHRANAWWGEGGLRDALTDLRDYMPHGNWGMYAPRWAAWQGDATAVAENVGAEEPPAPIREQMELYEQLSVSPPEEHADIMYEILDIAAERFPKIGTVARVPTIGINHNRLGNPVRDYMDGMGFMPPGPLELTQMYIKHD